MADINRSDTAQYGHSGSPYQDAVHITSEIGPLRSVILRRPGAEVENITPDLMDRLLFDDIPYLPEAQKEHDAFAQTLRDAGAEVLYLEDLTAQALADDTARGKFIDQILAESHYRVGYVLAENANYPFLLEPMPNLYFTRDPAAVIGNGVLINHMAFHARKRESLFMEYVLKYNPRFAGQDIPVWRGRKVHSRIEGGDVLVLNGHVVAIGISERTSANAIEDVARSLFGRSAYDTVIGINIPHGHATMHLDTVFTMINTDQFTVHPSIMDSGGRIDTYIIRPSAQAVREGNISSGQGSYGDGSIRITHCTDLTDVLKTVLGKTEVDLIPTGNADPVVAPREQWNDASNTFAVAPGEVVTYNRNYVSNDLLRRHGITVHEIDSSELSRGRGGPRCMTMPVVRDDVVQ